MAEDVQQAQISVLEFPVNVRTRKGMYISNRNQCVTEIVDNSVDEHVAGHCMNIAVILDEINKQYIVQDDGRGIPVTEHASYPGKSQVEIAFTTLHGGGKFGKDDGYAAKTGGMNGVGGSCVQALSETMCIQVATGGNKYQIDFAKGYVTEKIRVIEENVEERGTTVFFTLDEDVWSDSEPINTKSLRKRLKQLSYLNPGLSMYFFEKGPESEPEQFCYPEGFKTYVEELTANKKRITDIVSIKTSVNDIDIQLGLTYTDAYNDETYTFCNNMFTVDNGDHLTGFTMGLASAVKKYMADYKIAFEIKNDDIKEGLVGVIAVRVANPNFVGQAKSKLEMKSVKDAVKNITEDAVYDYMDKNPEIAKTIINKIESASKARIAAAKARDISRKGKSLIEGGVPAKLAECSSKKPEECEIYIVEGDSAGGTAKQGRDRKFQAILPVFGKILNVEKQRLTSIISNEKIGLAVKAFKTGIGEDFDITKCRYHKIIIMSDADVDGLHIQCLWATCFYRFLRPLIEAGYVYFAAPPLFKLTLNIGKKNEVSKYAYSDEERDQIAEEMGPSVEIQRYKGLGEMNATQLWDTTMNPATRRLYKLNLEDAEACEQAISLCMSEDTNARKEWIMENGEQSTIDV